MVENLSEKIWVLEFFRNLEIFRFSNIKISRFRKNTRTQIFFREVFDHALSTGEFSFPLKNFLALASSLSLNAPNIRLRNVLLDWFDGRVIFWILTYFLLKTLVFTDTKRECDNLTYILNRMGKASCAAIHGDKDQRERERVLQDFRTGRINVLVATDVAARGLGKLHHI